MRKEAGGQAKAIAEYLEKAEERLAQKLPELALKFDIGGFLELMMVLSLLHQFKAMLTGKIFQRNVAKDKLLWLAEEIETHISKYDRDLAKSLAEELRGLAGN